MFFFVVDHFDDHQTDLYSLFLYLRISRVFLSISGFTIPMWCVYVCVIKGINNSNFFIVVLSNIIFFYILYEKNEDDYYYDDDHQHHSQYGSFLN